MSTSSAAAKAAVAGRFDQRAPRIELPHSFDTRRITEVRHSLSGHPLLTLPALRELALRRPANRLRWHRADIPVSSHFGNAAREHANGYTIDETLRDIEHAQSWVFLMHVEEDAVYGPLVKQAFASVASQLEIMDPGVQSLAGWVFIASPGAVTPYHMDHECNFLLQIAGEKTISVWDPGDRSVVSQRELERFHATWSLDGTHWRQAIEPKATRVAAKPGVGVFMPFTAPHAVKNDDNVSITLSMTFQTRRTVRERKAFTASHRLRQLGLHPPAVGRSPVRDRMLEGLVDAYRVAGRLRGRHVHV